MPYIYRPLFMISRYTKMESGVSWWKYVETDFIQIAFQMMIYSASLTKAVRDGLRRELYVTESI